MDVQEIETAIAQLPVKKLIEFSVWFEEYQAQVWDKQIEDDLENGRLDAILAKIDDECEELHSV